MFLAVLGVLSAALISAETDFSDPNVDRLIQALRA